jgi:precorrin-4/cobalt-precorrin-4 C11-methyltransferase
MTVDSIQNRAMVYFIGAGPGDPELVTCKGKRIIEEADVVVYAGSLVNEEITKWAKPGAVVYNSAAMTLGETHEVLRDAALKGLLVARVHTGDPSLYGAIQEQMLLLERDGVAYEIVPGVSSAFAASATLKREYTIPGITQTVIFTRMEGRTPVPREESISLLASHRATMVIFLSVRMLDDVVKQLITGYDSETPVAVVYRASWPDEKVIRGTLCDITQKVKDVAIDRQALIVVGDILKDMDNMCEENIFSCLYDKAFAHMFRPVVRAEEGVV